MSKLMQHEIEAADIIARQPRILLFDDMGVGKTISVLNGLKKDSEGVTGVYKCIVCVPNTIIGQWSTEIATWLEDFSCVVAVGNKQQREVKYEYFNSFQNNVILITNYSVLVKDEFFKNVSVNALVLDEGYLIRNKRTKVHQFLKGLIFKYEKVILLSGNIDSFTNQQFFDVVDLMFPGEFLKATKEQLQESLGEKYIARKLDSIYSIDTPEIEIISQSLSEEQKSLLKEIAVEENRAMKTDNCNSLSFYNKRLSVLNTPRILNKNLELSPKEEFLLKILNSIKGKCVIYCPDRKFFKVIKSDLNNFDIENVIVSGEMPIYLRDRNLNLFKYDPTVKCLLISGVGKFGLNLQMANVLICMGVPKGKFELDQIIGRLNRLNQKEKVICYIPYHQDSEESNLIQKFV